MFKFKVSRRDNLHRYYVFEVFGYAMFIHHIHTDEQENIFHSHPWDGISFIFGFYLEQKLGCKPEKIGFVNLIKATEFHRVSLPYGPVWSVFFHSKRYNTWAVKDHTGKIIAEEPWRKIGGQTSYNPPEQG